MGFLHSNVCYPTIEAAKQAVCSGTSQVWGNTTSAYTLECSSTTFTGTTMSLCRRLNGGTCTTYTQPYPTFVSCDFEGGPTFALDWMYSALLLFVLLFSWKKLIALFTASERD